MIRKGSGGLPQDGAQGGVLGVLWKEAGIMHQQESMPSEAVLARLGQVLNSDRDVFTPPSRRTRLSFGESSWRAVPGGKLMGSRGSSEGGVPVKEYDWRPVTRADTAITHQAIQAEVLVCPPHSMSGPLFCQLCGFLVLSNLPDTVCLPVVSLCVQQGTSKHAARMKLEMLYKCAFHALMWHRSKSASVDLSLLDTACCSRLLGCSSAW